MFADVEGPYGSPTSDSERAKIRIETSKAMLVMISFTGRGQLEQEMEDAAALLQQYAGACVVANRSRRELLGNRRGRR